MLIAQGGLTAGTRGFLPNIFYSGTPTACLPMVVGRRVVGREGGRGGGARKFRYDTRSRYYKYNSSREHATLLKKKKRRNDTFRRTSGLPLDKDTTVLFLFLRLHLGNPRPLFDSKPARR